MASDNWRVLPVVILNFSYHGARRDHLCVQHFCVMYVLSAVCYMLYCCVDWPARDATVLEHVCMCLFQSYLVYVCFMCVCVCLIRIYGCFMCVCICFICSIRTYLSRASFCHSFPTTVLLLLLHSLIYHCLPCCPDVFAFLIL